MDKLEVARRQLGTALKLFLDDGDSVSIQCLAAGGGEIAEHLAASLLKPNFFSMAAEHSSLSLSEMRQARNVYWNAFKHATEKGGRARDDASLFDTFSDLSNELMLFVGWFDYMKAAPSLPIEVQVFQIWIWAKRIDTLAPSHDRTIYRTMFPDLATMSRGEQKAALREKIEWARRQTEAMSDVRTDVRPLVLPSV